MRLEHLTDEELLDEFLTAAVEVVVTAQSYFAIPADETGENELNTIRGEILDRMAGFVTQAE